MRVALVHYHLAPGGVTTVLRSASHALTAAGIPHVVLTGENVAGLGYLAQAGSLSATTLADQLRKAAEEALGAAPNIWHFHNHSLGKNCLFPDLVHHFATTGERLLLQIHDLAEHGRPANYSQIARIPYLYP
jgi:hypothetical protein